LRKSDAGYGETGSSWHAKKKLNLLLESVGGSPLDAAKAIAALAPNNVPGDKTVSGCCLLGLCLSLQWPLTAGTGSEVTQHA